MTTIFELVKAGDDAGIDELLKREPSAASSRDATGVSALMIALYHRKEGAAQRIRAALSSLDVFEAAAVGDLAQLRGALERDGGATKARSADGFTALHLAAFFGRTECARLLIDRGAEVNVAAANPMMVQPLHSAAAGRHGAVVKLLLAAGADVNARQDKGWMPLHAAAKNGDLDMVGLLLAQGADPTAQNDEGKSAIGIAADEGHLEVLKLLKARRRSGEQRRMEMPGPAAP